MTEKTDSLVNSARKLREKYQLDPHRPAYHFMAPEGVVHPFDPQGCIYWKGRYHLFYPLFIDGIGLWGHASSTDLLHWRHYPIAFDVAPEDPEEQVYAGGAFINKYGIPTMIYHGVNSGTCIATSEDEELIYWKKLPSNPVVALPKKDDSDYGLYHVWDTCGWVDGDTHYSICGNKPNTLPKTEGDTAYLFKSKDLINWEYVHPFYKSDRRWTDDIEDCSCPDFFPLGKKHMLMFISHTQGTQYYIGRYENEIFFPEHHGRMNWPGGPSFAQESLLDDRGRRIFWAWLCDTQTRDVQIKNGWGGVMSLPKVLSLDENDRLLIEPTEELSALRLNHRRYEEINILTNEEKVIEGVEGDCLELIVKSIPAKNAQFGVKVRCSPNCQEQTIISFDNQAKKLVIDTTRSSLSKNIVQPWPLPQASFFPQPLEDGRRDVRVQEVPFDLKSGEQLRLQIFLDKSVLEVFANGRQCISQRIYPTRDDSMKCSLFSNGNTTNVQSMDVWNIAATNPW